MKILLNILVIVAVMCFSGCEESENESYEEHVPAEGMGSLVVYDRSAVDVSSYLDGAFIGNIEAWGTQITDKEPGTYTVVIIQEDGNKNYTDDVEILEGVLTVITISYGTAGSSYFSVDTEYIDKK